MTDAEWADAVSGYIKAELRNRGVTYEGLARRLLAIGVHETVPSIKNKLMRGRFTAVFMIQVLTAIGCDDVSLARVLGDERL